MINENDKSADVVAKLLASMTKEQIDALLEHFKTSDDESSKQAKPKSDEVKNGDE